MQTLNNCFDKLSFSDRLHEVYFISRFLDDFICAANAEDWQISSEGLNGMHTIFMILNTCIAGLLTELHTLKD